MQEETQRIVLGIKSTKCNEMESKLLETHGFIIAVGKNTWAAHPHLMLEVDAPITYIEGGLAMLRAVRKTIGG